MEFGLSPRTQATSRQPRHHRLHKCVGRAACFVILGQEPAALQALIADATARLVELAEAGSSSQTTVAGVESSHAASEPTELLAPAAVPRTASSSQTRPQVGGTTTTKHRHAVDDLEEGTFEGSVDAMDGFLDDLGEDSD